MRLDASNLVNSISQLDRNKTYNYINPKNHGLIKVVRIDSREGPIIIKRWDPSKKQTYKDTEEESISSNLLWRVANAVQEDMPINIDRILGASYNTRSVLESLLAYTPEFHITFPGRIEIVGSSSVIKSGHKHLLWLPNQPHTQGIFNFVKNDRVISEIPSQQAVYESLILPKEYTQDLVGTVDIELQRRHAQIQVAIVLIGLQLGFRTWIAQNDKGIIYQDKKLGEMQGVISTLRDERLLMSHDDAIKAALLIDCIWFKNGRLMPAVMEVEYTTGITSGLTRMKNFHDLFPPFPTRYVIVAPDEDRNKFEREASKEQFKDLNSMFLPFSAVDELYSLCQRRKLKGVTEEFLDCFMEKRA